MNQHQDPQMVTYRQSKSVVGRPASYAAPGAAAGQGTSGHSFAPAGSAEQLGNRKHALGRDKEEDNYDNVLIGGWQRVPSQRSKAPEPPRSAIPSSHLNSPSVIKIGSIVLGRSGTPTNEQQPNEMTQSKIEKQQQQQQQGMRNPLRNFFQFFNKTNSGSKPTEGETSNEHYPQRSPSSSSQQKAPSTLSLNVGPSAEPSGTLPRTGNSMTGSMVVTSDGNHFHKSCSTNDAYTLKPSLTAQEMKQLDDLLTSFHEDAHATGNAGQKKSDGLRTKADSSTNGGVKPDQGKQAKAGKSYRCLGLVWVQSPFVLSFQETSRPTVKTNVPLRDFDWVYRHSGRRLEAANCNWDTGNGKVSLAEVTTERRGQDLQFWILESYSLSYCYG